MIILNEHIFQADAPELNLLNRSFKYGDGLFESIRIVNGNPLFLNLHFERLIGGMEILKFEFDENIFFKKIKKSIQKVIKVNEIKSNGRLRLQVYRAGQGAYTPTDQKPYFLIEAYSLKEDYYSSQTTFSLTDYHDTPLTYGLLSGIKTSNSLPFVLAGLHAKSRGFDEALLYCDGKISEASSANIFIIKNKTLFTPPLDSACMDGVMRKIVMNICTELKLSYKEKSLKSKHLQRADEIFLTNSIRGIIPIHAYNEIKFDINKAGITALLKKSVTLMARSAAGL